MKLSKTAISAIAAAMLFLLRNPSKFSWSDPNRCLMGWAVFLKTGVKLMELTKDDNKGYAAICANALDMDEDDFLAFYTQTLHNYPKQTRTRARQTVIKALGLILGNDTPKNYGMALFAAVLELLMKPAKYDQTDPDRCVVAIAASKFDPSFNIARDGYGSSYAALFGLPYETIDKIYLSDSWPEPFKSRYHGAGINNTRKRDGRRNEANIAAQRTLHYLANFN